MCVCPFVPKSDAPVRWSLNSILFRAANLETEDSTIPRFFKMVQNCFLEFQEAGRRSLIGVLCGICILVTAPIAQAWNAAPRTTLNLPREKGITKKLARDSPLHPFSPRRRLIRDKMEGA
jgi:hypothetical protein